MDALVVAVFFFFSFFKFKFYIKRRTKFRTEGFFLGGQHFHFTTNPSEQELSCRFVAGGVVDGVVMCRSMHQ